MTLSLYDKLFNVSGTETGTVKTKAQKAAEKKERERKKREQEKVPNLFILV